MVKPLSLSWSLLLKSLSWSLMKSPWFCPCVQCYIKGNYMQRNAELITITYLLAYTAYAHHICSVREYILYASYVRSSYQQKCSISYRPITSISVIIYICWFLTIWILYFHVTDWSVWFSDLLLVTACACSVMYVSKWFNAHDKRICLQQCNTRKQQKSNCQQKATINQ